MYHRKKKMKISNGYLKFYRMLWFMTGKSKKYVPPLELKFFWSSFGVKMGS